MSICPGSSDLLSICSGSYRDDDWDMWILLRLGYGVAVRGTSSSSSVCPGIAGAISSSHIIKQQSWTNGPSSSTDRQTDTSKSRRTLPCPLSTVMLHIWSRFEWEKRLSVPIGIYFEQSRSSVKIRTRLDNFETLFAIFFS